MVFHWVISKLGHTKKWQRKEYMVFQKNSYMLLSWLCQRLVDINTGTIAECTRQNGHFWQLFIAHSFSIQGFLMGCQHVITIDLTHLSGPYKGSLFSTTTYDVNDGMLPIAFGVVSSKNYEDWLWFLQKLKGILQDKEVVIISYRHQVILCSVSQLFGVKNRAYCYRHVKENFKYQ